MAIGLFLAEYLVELIHRGRTIPIKLSSNPIEQNYLSSITRGEIILTNGRGKYPITKEEVITSFITGKFELGYIKATDKYTNTLNIGDTVITSFEVIGEIKEIILEPHELLKAKTNQEEFKCFYKYDNILKPLITIKPLYILTTNPYTQAKEITPYKNKDELIQTGSTETIKYYPFTK